MKLRVRNFLFIFVVLGIFTAYPLLLAQEKPKETKEGTTEDTMLKELKDMQAKYSQRLKQINPNSEEAKRIRDILPTIEKDIKQRIKQIEELEARGKKAEEGGTPEEWGGGQPIMDDGTVMKEPVVKTPAVCDCSGKWRTNWGEMELKQSGSSVSGSYTHDQGRIKGTMTGNTLNGWWSEYPTYKEPSDAGLFYFNFADDCNSFRGRWKYGSKEDWHTDEWFAERISPSTAAKPQEVATPEEKTVPSEEEMKKDCLEAFNTFKDKAQEQVGIFRTRLSQMRENSGTIMDAITSLAQHIKFKCLVEKVSPGKQGTWLVNNASLNLEAGFRFIAVPPPSSTRTTTFGFGQTESFLGVYTIIKGSLKIDKYNENEYRNKIETSYRALFKINQSLADSLINQMKDKLAEFKARCRNCKNQAELEQKYQKALEILMSARKQLDDNLDSLGKLGRFCNGLQDLIAKAYKDYSGNGIINAAWLGARLAELQKTRILSLDLELQRIEDSINEYEKKIPELNICERCYEK